MVGLSQSHHIILKSAFFASISNSDSEDLLGKMPLVAPKKFGFFDSMEII